MLNSIGLLKGVCSLDFSAVSCYLSGRFNINFFFLGIGSCDNKFTFSEFGCWHRCFYIGFILGCEWKSSVCQKVNLSWCCSHNLFSRIYLKYCIFQKRFVIQLSVSTSSPQRAFLIWIWLIFTETSKRT